MAKDPDEWLKQADYDMATAEFLLDGGRHSYAVFICHLSIEKALKGLYCQEIDPNPPRIHNLLYFIEKLRLTLPEGLHDAVFTLNRLCVVTRYPDDLDTLQREFGTPRTKELVGKSKEVLRWLRAKLSKP